MKIQKDCKIETATTKDKSRKAFREPYLDIKDGKGTLVATDGRILVHIPVEITPAGFVSSEALKAAREVSGRSEFTEVALNGNATFPNGATMPRDGESAGEMFPNWRQAIPDDYAAPVVVIGIDALRLWQLAQAMGTQCVEIKIMTNDKPFFVAPASSGRYSDVATPVNMAARGVIMPVTLPESP